MSRSARWVCCALAAAAAAVAVIGCGFVVHSANVSRSTLSAELRGSPPPLSDLHMQANRLIHGGPHAFTALLHRVRGYPIVINEWASWCTNCAFESPAFQRMAAKYGARIAFVGVDVADHDGQATAFLRRFPVTYPSYVDPGQSIARAIQASGYYPQTVYLDRHGRLVIDHGGSYASAAGLEKDIRRYALR